MFERRRKKQTNKTLEPTAATYYDDRKPSPSSKQI